MIPSLYPNHTDSDTLDFGKPAGLVKHAEAWELHISTIHIQSQPIFPVLL